jgi:hypothetical protein
VVCAGSLGRRAGHPDRAVVAQAPGITPTANGFVDLVSVAAVFRRKLHDRLMDFGRDGQHAVEGLFRPLPSATNGSTQHERNAAFPASFASVFHDTDTNGLIALVVVLAIVLIAAGLSRCRKCPPG